MSTCREQAEPAAQGRTGEPMSELVGRHQLALLAHSFSHLSFPWWSVPNPVGRQAGSPALFQPEGEGKRLEVMDQGPSPVCQAFSKALAKQCATGHGVAATTAATAATAVAAAGHHARWFWHWPQGPGSFFPGPSQLFAALFTATWFKAHIKIISIKM